MLIEIIRSLFTWYNTVHVQTSLLQTIYYFTATPLSTGKNSFTPIGNSSFTIISNYI